MKLGLLHEDPWLGAEVAKLLRAYLEENGICTSHFGQRMHGGFITINRMDRQVTIMAFNGGAVVASTAGRHLKTNCHEPDSFQKVEAFIRKHLNLEARG